MAYIAAVIYYYRKDLIAWFEAKFEHLLIEYDAQRLSVVAAFYSAEELIAHYKQEMINQKSAAVTSCEKSSGVVEATEQQNVDVAHSCANLWDVIDLKKFCNFSKVVERHLKKFGSVQYRFD